MRQTAGDFKNDNGYDIPINILAEKISELAQEYSQHIYMRPLCVVSLLFSINDEGKPQLYKLDPAGHFMGYRGAATGEKEAGANTHLEKALKKGSPVDLSHTIDAAIRVFGEVRR